MTSYHALYGGTIDSERSRAFTVLSAAKTLRRAMTFAEDTSGGIDNRDSQHPSIVEFQSQAGSNPFGRIHLHRAFDAKESGNGHAGAFRHSLITAYLIRNWHDNLAVLQQFPCAGALFDEFHHGVILSLCENPGMEFELQPNLKGTRVQLRPLLVEDFEQLFAAASDPLLWAQHPEPLRYRRDVFQKFFDGAMESKGAFAVMDIASGRMIGSSRYYDYKTAQREVKIGYTFVVREFWGTGYNPEMKKLMLDHAFRYVDRVLFEIGESNIRSQTAIQRIGARLIGKSDLPGLDGTMLKMVLFEIRRT